MNKTIQTFFAYQFIKNLTKDFKSWDAYKIGLIDEDGNKIRDAENSKEQEYFGTFYNLVRKVKRLMNKLPGARTFVGSLIAAGFLLREANENQLDEEFIDLLLEETVKQGLLENTTFLAEEIDLIELEPGIYKNKPETIELYGSENLFYVNESKLPNIEYGVPYYTLESVMHGTYHIPFDHLIKIK